MTSRGDAPRDAVEGVVDEVKGKAKEAVGALTGNSPMRRAGRAQQDKAEAKREAARKEAEAQKARASARAHEARQRAHES